MEEAVITSLIYVSKHAAPRVAKVLSEWEPRAPLSRDLRNLLRDHVREKPLHVWMRILGSCWILISSVSMLYVSDENPLFCDNVDMLQ